MSLEDIKRKRQEDHTTRDKELDATKKALKERNQKKVQAKVDNKKAKGAPKAKDMTKNAPGGAPKQAGK